MKTKSIDPRKLYDFEKHLRDEEKSEATIEKYMRDIGYFVSFIADRDIDKKSILEYKAGLIEKYAVASANSMIAALNAFLRFCNRHELCIKQFKIQRTVYCSEERELSRAEYIRLLDASRKKNNERLNLIIQTICGTGIRVSELQYITVEALIRGEAIVNCKGKKQKSIYRLRAEEEASSLRKGSQDQYWNRIYNKGR